MIFDTLNVTINKISIVDPENVTICERGEQSLLVNENYKGFGIRVFASEANYICWKTELQKSCVN